MTDWSNVFSIMRNERNNIVSITNNTIETQRIGKRYYNYSEGRIKKTTIILHYTMKKMSS